MNFKNIINAIPLTILISAFLIIFLNLFLVIIDLYLK